MKHIQTWGDRVFRPSIHNRKTLDDISLAVLGTSRDKDTWKEWAVDNKLNKKMSWVLPQLYALVGNFKLPKNAEGKIDGNRFWEENLDMTDPKNIGIYRFFQIHPRGSVISDQNKPTGKIYCRLVPLVLSAVKQMQDVPYSAWDRETLRFVVDPDLCKTMLADPIKYTREELLCLRDVGLTIKSGDGIGGMRNPTTYAKVHTTGDEDFDKMPDLWRIMATQIWVAHPSNRLPCMVLDPTDWDATPEPLISSELIAASANKRADSKTTSKKYDTDLRWDAD